MAKRGQGQGPHGHDATQDLSLSQLVVPAKPPVLPRKSNPKNDMSVWGGVVVGTQDFAPPPKAKKQSSSKKWIIAAAAVAVLGAGGYFAVTNFGGAGDKTPEPSAKATDEKIAAADPKPTDPKPAEAPKPAEGSAPAAAGSGSVGAGSGSGSGREPTVAATHEVDAISGVAPIIKRPATKKKAVRKTTAKATTKKKVVPKKKKR
jgi:hypothetical protein